MKKSELESRLVTLLAGRAAEELVFNSVTTGASNDIEQATNIARAMIKRAYSLNSRVAIFQTQDLLYLDNKARMNFPSTIGENWRWRMTKEQYEIIDASYYKHLAELYYR